MRNPAARHLARSTLANSADFLDLGDRQACKLRNHFHRHSARPHLPNRLVQLLHRSVAGRDRSVAGRDRSVAGRDRRVAGRDRRVALGNGPFPVTLIGRLDAGLIPELVPSLPLRVS